MTALRGPGIRSLPWPRYDGCWGEVPPDFDDDLDCAALSAQVVTGADVVEWRDVRWQVTYERFLPAPDEYGPLLTFRVDRSQYEQPLRGLLDHYRAGVVAQPPAPDVASERRRWSGFRRR